MGFLSLKSIEDEDSDDAPFIFSWKKDHRSSWHLFLFILFSTLVHGSGFYLFQVVYPEPVRVEPTPDFVTILDFANPSVRSTIQKAKDRTIFLHAPSETADVRVRLNDHAVRLIPSFTKVRPVFLPPRDKRNLIPLPIKDGGSSTLGDGHIELHFSPELEKLGIAPWSIFRDYLGSAGDLPTLRVKLKVLPTGKVASAEIESQDIPDSAKNEFNRAVESTLRFRTFAADDKTKTIHGWVEIRPKAK